MIIARPTVEEERWLLLADRYPAQRAAAEELGAGGRWKTTTWLGRVLGFLLGLFGTSLLGGMLYLFPSPLMVGGVLLMLVAEWLVAQRHVYRSGVEEAVYLCGVVAIVVQLLIWNRHGDNDSLGVALIATAVLLVGWRLLNPLFTTLAWVGYSVAIALADQKIFSDRLNMRAAAIFCAALALVALIAGARQWRRPSHDRMCDGLVILMPALSCGWLLAYDWHGSAQYMTLAAASGFLLVWLIVGVQRRSHPPLIGAMGILVAAAYALHLLLPWTLHWQLIVAGTVLLAVAVLLERGLRHRTTGITASAVEEPAGLDLAQIAGAMNLAPAPGQAPPQPVQGQGGGFGGGGASGRF